MKYLYFKSNISDIVPFGVDDHSLGFIAIEHGTSADSPLRTMTGVLVVKRSTISPPVTPAQSSKLTPLPSTFIVPPISPFVGTPPCVENGTPLPVFTKNNLKKNFSCGSGGLFLTNNGCPFTSTTIGAFVFDTETGSICSPLCFILMYSSSLTTGMFATAVVE